MNINLLSSSITPSATGLSRNLKSNSTNFKGLYNKETNPQALAKVNADTLRAYSNVSFAGKSGVESSKPNYETEYQEAMKSEDPKVRAAATKEYAEALAKDTKTEADKKAQEARGLISAFQDEVNELERGGSITVCGGFKFRKTEILGNIIVIEPEESDRPRRETRFYGDESYRIEESNANGKKLYASTTQGFFSYYEYDKKDDVLYKRQVSVDSSSFEIDSYKDRGEDKYVYLEKPSGAVNLEYREHNHPDKNGYSELLNKLVFDGKEWK